MVLAMWIGFWCCLTYHEITTALLVPIWRRDRKGNSIVSAKQYIGTPCFVQRVKKWGAWPSSARPYSVREAAYLLGVNFDLTQHIGGNYTYVFPAEKMLVTSKALTRLGKPWIPKFCMANT